MSPVRFPIVSLVFFIVRPAMANYPQELAQDAVYQSHTGHMTEFRFLPNPAFKAEY